MSKKKLVLLGSTGSIGTQTLEVVRRHSDSYQVVALVAYGSKLELLLEQILEFSPALVGVTGGKERLEELRLGYEQALSKEQPKPPVTFVTADTVAEDIILQCPKATVVNAITGSSGMRASLAAVCNGNPLSLANKESLVVAGSLIRRSLSYPGQIQPIDSEHSAIWQGLQTGVHEKGMTQAKITGKSELDKVVLTASGGPFFRYPKSKLADVTLAQALNHPTWRMGRDVTLNSSTLMNKALEVIEASYLFDLDESQIETVIHPQSLVHSLVTWQDGSSVAQVAPADMKIPISVALSWPKRLPCKNTSLDFSRPQTWIFEPVNQESFEAISLARFCLKTNTHPAVLNEANEEALHAFLTNQIRWIDIVEVVKMVVLEHVGQSEPDLEELEQIRTWSRMRAKEIISKFKR